MFYQFRATSTARKLLIQLTAKCELLRKYFLGSCQARRRSLYESKEFKNEIKRERLQIYLRQQEDMQELFEVQGLDSRLLN